MSRRKKYFLLHFTARGDWLFFVECTRHSPKNAQPLAVRRVRVERKDTGRIGKVDEKVHVEVKKDGK